MKDILLLFLIFISPFLAVFLAIYLTVWVVKTVINNLRFDAYNISAKDKWVKKTFYSIAHSIVHSKYKMNGKPIRTQKGAYRANYMNDVNKTAAGIIHECCQGNHLSSDFCRYLDQNYPTPRRKDLFYAINGFRTERYQAIQENMNQFLNRAETITPEEFFEIKQKQKGDIVGVYIIHNETTDQYYVGQAKKLFFRINQHFTGHGNGDVYADYKYGNDFSIKIIKLSESGYDDLDKLEKDMIKKYHAYSIGYNRTSGNN